MEVKAYTLVTTGQPLELRTITLREPLRDEAVIEVRACGLCHTDLAFADGSVAPRHALPLVLGHEVVGKVVRAAGEFEKLVGRDVIVPAVLPCGKCAFCAAGRANACPAQRMPGNHIDGGFATHIIVPAAPLVTIDDAPASVDVRSLSVVADAVSTAYQAVRRAELAREDTAFVVGAGGVGGYVIQIAHALGAHVVALDVSAARLELVAGVGADKSIVVSSLTPKEVRQQAHALAASWGVPSFKHRIFECSGTTAGQQLAFTLLGPAATYVQVGFTPKPVELRLSNIMAFDATLHGTWGCPPDAYRDVLRMLYAGEIQIAPFVEYRPMSRINESLDDMAHHRLERRVVFDPRA